MKVFQIVLQIQQLVTHIPGQIERQQPVYLLDALGKANPFYLGNFAIQDSVTKHDIDLTADWEACFFPGQQVDMSMLFALFVDPASQRNCPKCNHPGSQKNDNIDIGC